MYIKGANKLFREWDFFWDGGSSKIYAIDITKVILISFNVDLPLYFVF